MVQPVMNHGRHAAKTVLLVGLLLFARPAFAAEGVADPGPAVPHNHAHPPAAPSVIPAPGALSADAVLAWDKETHENTVPHGTVDTKFTFLLTNISPAEVTISGVHTSCGCTAAQLPQIPWVLPAGGTGEIKVTMNVANKTGLISKTVTVNTDKGPKVLFVKANVLPQTADQMAGGDRSNNQKIALADRQAVFRGDCARCHSDSKGKMGHELYVSVCGVCHEAEHRASMVPSLQALPNPTNAEYWRNWVTHGKEGTLMPAFSEKENGILTDQQIDSLVKYLGEKFPSKTASQTGTQPAVPSLPKL
ncbi:MAG TPA: DUF1573 domain-containing protein [Verrucomicrobiae bacterium]|nr:DUF1573 domain-containing protein [Verrucomicrobiae bacterium]